MPPPQMTILNAPLRDACIARRERTNTPTQALLLLNESEYLKAAAALAATVLQQPIQQRISFAWESVTARLPDEKELLELQKLLGDLQAKYSTDPELADQLVQSLELSQDNSLNGEKMSPNSNAELAAWTVLGSVLYNLDITKTKD